MTLENEMNSETNHLQEVKLATYFI